MSRGPVPRGHQGPPDGHRGGGTPGGGHPAAGPQNHRQSRGGVETRRGQGSELARGPLPEWGEQLAAQAGPPSVAPWPSAVTSPSARRGLAGPAASDVESPMLSSLPQSSSLPPSPMAKLENPLLSSLPRSSSLPPSPMAKLGAPARERPEPSPDRELEPALAERQEELSPAPEDIAPGNAGALAPAPRIRLGRSPSPAKTPGPFPWAGRRCRGPPLLTQN